MAQQWSGRSQANTLGFSVFLWLIRRFPLSFSYALLRPVALYYLFFSKHANKSLIQYFSKLGLARPSSPARRYKAFYLFGQALIDKLAIYMNAGKELSFDFDNEQQLHRFAADGRGALLLGAHLGNWEIAGQLLYRIDAPVHIVMLDNEQDQIKNLLEQHSAGKSFSIIPISEDITFVIKIKEALDNGGLVCMHADRFMEGMRTLEADFLDSTAQFPFGPFFMGGKLKAPVAFVYAMKDGKSHYQFSCSQPFENTDPRTLLESYVDLLESKARQFPYQWYNFYPFWK